MVSASRRTYLGILIDYLGDSRRMLVEHAQCELIAITQQPLPPDAAAWHSWLQSAANLAPTPWAGPDQ